jgi:hypothetical protein
MPTPERRRKILRVLAVLLVTASVFSVARWPTTRFVGVNFVVSQQTLPLWAKAADFIDRDVNIAQTARAVLGNVQGDEARAAAALAWTRANIRNTPEGFPIVDDHIWYTIVRGYGQPDQQADVFTTLLTYAGVRAYWSLAGKPPDEIPLSYVWIRDRWRVYDVTSGLVFRAANGDQATPQDLADNHDLIRTAATGRVDDVNAYVTRFDGYAAPQAPDVLRADLQMPRRRVWHEMKKLFGLQGREWHMRQPAAAEGRAQ